MKRMNKDGVLLCELQATAFEKSIDKMESSSEIFIRRFMRSRIAKRLDDGSVLESNIWSYVKKKYKLNVTNFPFFCNC